MQKESLLFVGDDDVINSEYLEKTISYISNTNANWLLQHISHPTQKVFISFKSFKIQNYLIQDYVKCIYNCILLSGIIISRNEILKLVLKKLKV